MRNYRLYFSGQLVSLTGTWAQRVAQDWLVLQLTNSGTALGIVTALQFAPALLLSLYGGALADRGDKRRLLLATQTGIGLAALALGLLDVTGAVQIWHVLVLAAILGVVSAIDTPIRQSFVVEMVGAEDLPNAVALNATTFNLARIIGPAIAGVVISTFGTGWAFLGNAASTLAVLLGLSLMRKAELFPSKPVDRQPGQYRDARALRPQPVGPDTADGADLRARHVRLQLPDHDRPDRQTGLSPRRRLVRAAVDDAGGGRDHRRDGGHLPSPPTDPAVLDRLAAVGFSLTEIIAAVMPNFGPRRLRWCRPAWP